MFSVAESEDVHVIRGSDEKSGFDEEAGKPLTDGSERGEDEVGPVVVASNGVRRKLVGSVRRPFFHPDIDGALQSAIRSIEGQ